MVERNTQEWTKRHAAVWLHTECQVRSRQHLSFKGPPPSCFLFWKKTSGTGRLPDVAVTAIEVGRANAAGVGPELAVEVLDGGASGTVLAGAGVTHVGACKTEQSRYLSMDTGGFGF